MSPDRRDERGAVALVVTFMMIVLCICAAMVTDLGMAYVNKRQAQTAADAAVLAAGRVIAGQPGSCTDIAANTLLMQTANEAADDLRQENLPGSPDADLVASCSTGSLTLDYHVNVDSPLSDRSIVMGTDQINVDREAQVTLQPGGMSGGCGLCFIGTGPMGTGDAELPGQRRQHPHQRQPQRRTQRRVVGGRPQRDDRHLRQRQRWAVQPSVGARPGDHRPAGIDEPAAVHHQASSTRLTRAPRGRASTDRSRSPRTRTASCRRARTSSPGR